MEKQAEAIFRKWGLDFAIVGNTTDTLRFVIKHEGEVKADLPIKQTGRRGARNMTGRGSQPKTLAVLNRRSCPQ